VNAHLKHTLADIGKDWRKVCGPHCNGEIGSPLYDIRIIATGKLYRIPDFTYQRMLKHNAEPTPEGWLEITEDGEPIEEDVS
jgi:hypothetical protein